MVERVEAFSGGLFGGDAVEEWGVISRRKDDGGRGERGTNAA